MCRLKSWRGQSYRTDAQAVASPPTFAVLRWLSLTVTAIIIGVTIVLGFAILGRTQSYLVRQNEDYANNLAFHLNDVLYIDFAAAITTPANTPLPDTASLDQAVHRLLIGLNIRRLTIYDQSARVIYTTQPDQILPEDRAAVGRALENALRNRAQSTFIHQPAPDGMTASILATYVPIHPRGNPAGAPNVLGAFAIEQDLSVILDQIRAEQYLTAGVGVLLMAMLLIALLMAIRWAGGVMRAQHSELLHRHAALVELQQTRDDLTRLIVHDLRNPLTAIGGYLDLMALTNHDPGRHDLITVTRNSTRTMQTLISTILDLQRLQNGSVPLDRAWIDIGTLLNTSAQEFCGWAERDGKDIQVVVAPDVPHLYADHDMLQRVVANLLSNALKHTAIGTSVTIAADADAALNTMILSISDTGPGIPADILPRLFTRYVRGSGRKEGGSSGLGLAFCRLAVEAHGGTISVTSTPEHGTTFTIRLPLRQLAPSLHLPKAGHAAQ